MSKQSSLEFRSNLYPLAKTGSIIRDRAFLDSISDPFALKALWKYNATRGSLFNRLQRRQHSKGEHCTYAESDDYPWGTRRVNGSLRVVCLCENWACPRISECRPGVEVPDTLIQPEENEKPERPETVEKTPLQDDAESVIQEPSQSESTLEKSEDSSSNLDGDDGASEKNAEPEFVEEREDIFDQEDGPSTHEEPLDAVEDFFEEPKQKDYFRKHYDVYQARIVEADPSERIYVTAGPGTGKTHTLIEKLKYMIDIQEVDPGSIMVMSFTRAAVQVVKDRLQKAALDNELMANWQAIEITTFDKFCTRLLYWLKTNEPKLLGRREIGSMDYDHRIYAAARVIREQPDILGQCLHLIVDETQDLVGSRAKLVTSILESLRQDCGVTLLGDRCQSVYDYQVKANANSEAFYDRIQEITDFSSAVLEKNYRQNIELPYSLNEMRKEILARDVPAANEQVRKILDSLGEPKDELRSLNLNAMEEQVEGSLGILTRTNAEATLISSLLYKHDIVHTLFRAEREAFWTKTIADVFMNYSHSTIDEDGFIGMAESKGLNYEQAIRAWMGLSSLRGANREGMRYKVEDLLRAMSEEIVPESLVARRMREPKVTISTIHGAKGREFDAVWLISSDLEKISKTNTLDEQKVAYVALSRARRETVLQKIAVDGLRINRTDDRCYQISRPLRKTGRRNSKKRLTHLELHNMTDIAFTSLLDDPYFIRLAEEGTLEGTPIRFCLPEEVPVSGPVAYDIETDDGLYLGKTSLSFISYYEKYYEKVIGGLPSYLPEAFDEIYIDKIISCVGKSSTAPAVAKKYGDYAVWYGFTVGGFAHADNSQSH